MVSKALGVLSGFVSRVSGGSNEVVNQAKELERMYADRKRKFNSWYSLLSLQDELFQENMESFVGNDPRTTWNMANFLLQPEPMVNKLVTIDGVPMIPQQAEAAVIIEQYFNTIWKRIDKQDVNRGRPSWFWSFIGYILATGWYVVPSFVNRDGELVVDYWNPATVFPEFSGEIHGGLIKLARVRSISALQAFRSSTREGWRLPEKRAGNIIEYQLWIDTGVGVFHGVSFDNQLVKELTETGLDKIPIRVGAAGAIPVINVENRDKAPVEGESILAVNEHLYRNFNKTMTFLLQLLRDTANPRVFQKTSSNQKIFEAAEWYARGAFFSGGINDSIEILGTPPIPVELTNMAFQQRNQIQKGSFSDVIFGNVLGEVSTTVLSQAADSARQLLFPYHDVIQSVVSSITDSYLKILMVNPDLRPTDWPEMDSELMSNVIVESRYSITIPGDLQNRINIAKAMNPNLRVPIDEVLQLLIPEVTNPVLAQAKLDSEDVRQMPQYKIIQMITTFKAAAAEADRAENSELARLYSSAAGQLERGLSGQPSSADRLGQTTPSGNDNQQVNRRLGR